VDEEETRAQVARAQKTIQGLVNGLWKSPATREQGALAFARALVATAPGSDHGRLLVAALKATADTDEVRAVLALAKAGVSPTEAAVHAWLQASAERRENQARLRREAATLAARDGARAREWTAQVVAQTGAGPTWAELSTAMGWPRRVRNPVMAELAAAGWITTGKAHRSLRPGRATKP
jgi:hypothetical protein